VQQADEFVACLARLFTDDTGPYGQHAAGHVSLTPAPAPRVSGPPEQVGDWRVVADARVNGTRINAIHAILMPNSTVLITAGSGNNPGNFRAGTFLTFVWDPATNTMTSVPTPRDVFCSGHELLPDGRVLFLGGTKAYPVSGVHGYWGDERAYIFDWHVNRYKVIPSMHVGRWYPFAVTDAHGDKIVGTGLAQNGHLTNINEIYLVSLNQWRLLGKRPFPLYATVVLTADKRLFYTGVNVFGRSGIVPGIWSQAINAYRVVAGLPNLDCRDQGAAVLLYPAQAQQVMALGGGCATDTTTSTALVNLATAAPRYAAGPPLPHAAMHLCATTLADGTLFVSGGGNHNSNPVLAAEIYRPGGGWTEVASPTVQRMYHSECMLLPDGSVATMGSNQSPSFESRIEVYRPPYMFAPSRPSIDTAVGAFRLGGTYTVSFSSQDGNLTDAMLIRPAAVTHSSDPNQRAIKVPLNVVAPGQVALSITSNPGIAPPGYYLLFVVDQGIPSVARWVRLTP
jgi:hypothetical protein